MAVRNPRDPAITSHIMSRVRSKDSKAEVALRRELHGLGLRYRIHVRNVPGHPDICIQTRRIAVFVDGDLWHGNPGFPAKRGKASFAEVFPTRTDWWMQKIERNVRRDVAVRDELESAGWLVIRVWESDVLSDANSVAVDILEKISRSDH